MAQTPEYAEQPSRKLIQPARLPCKKSKTPPDAYNLGDVMRKSLLERVNYNGIMAEFESV